MNREAYTLFSPARIGSLSLPNRLVRSAAWDPVIIARRAMLDEVLQVYRRLAEGGVGLIITGGLPVYDEDPATGRPLYHRHLAIAGIERLAEAVHTAGRGCRVVAQLETGHTAAGPSDYPSPFRAHALRPLTAGEIQAIAASFVEAALAMQAAGFDGVQLHAAHGGLLSLFLSPHANRRTDEYGGPPENRLRFLREIVSGIRRAAPGFPVLVKLNGTDCLPGGTDAATFPALAAGVARAGVDAMEVSGGLWDCLARPQSELGFRPVPSPESRTRLRRPESQSYFLPCLQGVDVGIPRILVGGNRDVERIELIVRSGQAEFISLCRPLIREPDLPDRWRAGRGSRLAACISCNACLYDMRVHPGRPGPGVVRCVHIEEPQLRRPAQRWLTTWVRQHRVKPAAGGTSPKQVA